MKRKNNDLLADELLNILKAQDLEPLKTWLIEHSEELSSELFLKVSEQCAQSNRVDLLITCLLLNQQTGSSYFLLHTIDCIGKCSDDINFNEIPMVTTNDIDFDHSESIQTKNSTFINCTDHKHQQPLILKSATYNHLILNEAMILHHLRPHPNLIQWKGLFVQYQIPKLLHLGVVVEYLPEGNLQTYLNNTDIPWADSVAIAQDIAEGLKYLHSFANPILHRDLCTQNVLLTQTDRMHAKITDFGLSVIAKENRTYSDNRQVGRSDYLAPECFVKTNNMFLYSEFSDIYSLSVLYDELLLKPSLFDQLSISIEDIETDTHKIKSEYKDIMLNVFKKNLHLQLRHFVRSSTETNIPKGCPPEQRSMAQLLKRCGILKATDRPSASEITRELIPLIK